MSEKIPSYQSNPESFMQDEAFPNPNSKEMLYERARDIGINVEIKRVDRKDIPNNRNFTFELQKSNKDELFTKPHIIDLRNQQQKKEIPTPHLHTDGFAYQEDKNGIYGFIDGRYIELTSHTGTSYYDSTISNRQYTKKKYSRVVEYQGYNGRDTHGNLYKTEDDGNRGYSKEKGFFELKRAGNILRNLHITSKEDDTRYTGTRYTQYPPHKILTIPKDLKTYELPAIIKAINRETFSHIDKKTNKRIYDQLPNHSATYQMQAYLLQTIAYIYTLDSAKDTNGLYKPQYKKALKNLYIAYQQLNPQLPTGVHHPLGTINGVAKLHKEILAKELGNKTNNELYRLSNTIHIEHISKGLKKYRGYTEKNYYGRAQTQFQNYQTLLKNTKSNNTKDELHNLNHLISHRLDLGMDQTLFDHGIQNIYNHFTEITNIDRLEHKHSPYDVLLYEIENTITSSIELQPYFEKVKDGTQLKNKEKISCINTILNIFSSNSLLISSKNHHQLDKIFEDNKTQCVLLSTVVHSYLTKLGIKHTGLIMPGHAALMIYIGGKQRYFDAINTDKVEINKTNRKHRITETKVWKDKVNGGFDQSRVIEGPVKDIFIGTLKYNQGGSYTNDKAIETFTKSIDLIPTDTFSYLNRGIVYAEQGKYQKAINDYNTALSIDAQTFYANNNKGYVQLKLGRYEEAKLSFVAEAKLPYNKLPQTDLPNKSNDEILDLLTEKDYQVQNAYLLRNIALMYRKESQNNQNETKKQELVEKAKIFYKKMISLYEGEGLYETKPTNNKKTTGLRNQDLLDLSQYLSKNAKQPKQ